MWDTFFEQAVDYAPGVSPLPWPPWWPVSGPQLPTRGQGTDQTGWYPHRVGGRQLCPTYRHS